MTTGALTIDLSTIITTILGALVLAFLRDNTTEKKELKKATQDLREEVIILKTEVKPINEAVRLIPVLSDKASKAEKDLNEYFARLKKVEKKIGIDIIEF